MVKRRDGRESASPPLAPIGPRHGRDEAATWLHALGLDPIARWHVEVSLDGGARTRFHLNVYAEEWGFAFHHARRSSWVRVTDIPFVHGRDDFKLIAMTPDLSGLSAFLAKLETTHAIEFARSSAIVRSNVARATTAVRKWLVQSALSANELCGNEMYNGIRCTRSKGHDGHHTFESHEGALRWKPTR